MLTNFRHITCYSDMSTVGHKLPQTTSAYCRCRTCPVTLAAEFVTMETVAETKNLSSLTA